MQTNKQTKQTKQTSEQANKQTNEQTDLPNVAAAGHRNASPVCPQPVAPAFLFWCFFLFSCCFVFVVVWNAVSQSSRTHKQTNKQTNKLSTDSGVSNRSCWLAPHFTRVLEPRIWTYHLAIGSS
jgi:hypothetical protein